MVFGVYCDLSIMPSIRHERRRTSGPFATKTKQSSMAMRTAFALNSLFFALPNAVSCMTSPIFQPALCCRFSRNSRWRGPATSLGHGNADDSPSDSSLSDYGEWAKPAKHCD